MIVARESLILASQHPETHRKTLLLEGLEKFPRQEIADLTFEKPVFVQPLQGELNLKEHERVHLECHVTPMNDPKLRTEWFVNGKPLMQCKIVMHNTF